MNLKCRKSICIITIIVLLLFSVCTLLIYSYRYVELHVNTDLVNETSGENEVATNKLLFMTASYSFSQFHSLQKVLDNIRDICNSGWDVTVLLQTASGLNTSHPRYKELIDRMFCVRTQTYIPLILEEFGQIGFGLNSKHRAFMRHHLTSFDYFSYAEEDMVLSVSHLNAYVSAQDRIRTVLGRDAWLRYFIGFIRPFRYEDSIVDSERVTWEYLAHQIHVVDMGRELGKYVVTNNLNQAIYILSREHVVNLEEKCDFLTNPGRNPFYQELRKAQNKDWKYMSVGVSEWSSSFQQVLQCGMRRIIPVDHFQLFMIHHSTNIAQKRRLRKELLTYTTWMDVLTAGGGGAGADKKPSMTVDQVYNEIIFNQYNLGLIDTQAIKAKNIKWAWSNGTEW